MVGGGKSYIALDIGPIGQLMAPMGTLTFDDAYSLLRSRLLLGKIQVVMRYSLKPFLIFMN
ncbi:hypothetical protein AZF37_08130 [endosymbiont 'TC1' of Trimyema compressum]|nr:hypothetical protein AZF37_08130 [endosymbiont 'TC1' of Trimyema compressum]